MTWTFSQTDELRGCIGTFDNQYLCESLAEYALIAAIDDDRFQPISKVELPFLSVTVSLLTNFHQQKDLMAW